MGIGSVFSTIGSGIASGAQAAGSAIASGAKTAGMMGGKALGLDTTPKARLLVRKPLSAAELNQDKAIIDKSVSDEINALQRLVTAEGTKAVSLSESIDKFAELIVQYNPSSIQFSAVAAGEYTTFTGPADVGIRQTVNVCRPSSITMKVQLIFDKVNQLNAFSIYNQGLSLGTALSAVTLLARDYTVQPQVEGLIGLLTRTHTRQVIFLWSEMFFHGDLQGVEANYTMFNKAGNPIRATMDLMIKQSDTSQAFPSDKEYWDNAFTKSWGKAGEDSISTAKSMTGTSTFF